MKISTLIMALAVGSFLFLSSCNKDPDDGCTRCSLDIQTVNCHVDVCDDGSHERGGGLSCISLDAILTGMSTKEEKVEALRNFGCDCD